MPCGLLLRVLADFLAHTVPNLHQLALPLIRIGVREQGIAVLRINVPQHGTPQVRDVVHFEQPVPAAHPGPGGGVQDQHLVLGPGRLRVGYLAALDVLERHLLAVLADPVIAAVFFVREECGGGVFPETGGDGEATRSGPNDEDIVNVLFFTYLFGIHVCDMDKRVRQKSSSF